MTMKCLPPCTRSWDRGAMKPNLKFQLATVPGMQPWTFAVTISTWHCTILATQLLLGVKNIHQVYVLCNRSSGAYNFIESLHFCLNSGSCPSSWFSKVIAGRWFNYFAPSCHQPLCTRNALKTKQLLTSQLFNISNFRINTFRQPRLIKLNSTIKLKA